MAKASAHPSEAYRWLSLKSHPLPRPFIMATSLKQPSTGVWAFLALLCPSESMVSTDAEPGAERRCPGEACSYDYRRFRT